MAYYNQMEGFYQRVKKAMTLNGRNQERDIISKAMILCGE
jgi:hypothetical protein